MEERDDIEQGDTLEARRKKLENLNVQEALAALEEEFNAALKLGPKRDFRSRRNAEMVGQAKATDEHR
jgi:hypothetical protein